MSPLDILNAIWFRSLELEDGETVVWSAAANRQQGWRAVGGRLTLTSSRLVFKANRFDALLDGRDLSLPREALSEFGIAERSLANGPFSGGIRHRLQVSLRDGSEELFVVFSAKKASSRLRELTAL